MRTFTILLFILFSTFSAFSGETFSNEIFVKPENGNLLAEIADQNFRDTQNDCAYTLSTTGAAFTATGGTGSFNITTQPGCAFSASAAAPFISLNNATGVGSGTVTFTVAVSTEPARTGTIILNGQIFTVSQTDGCTYLLSQTSANFGYTGGQGSFGVTTGNGCVIRATSNDFFIIITGVTGVGSGNVFFDVFGSDIPQTGTINVNGQIFTVYQTTGCLPVIAPSNFNFTSAGGTGSVNLTVEAGCGYSVKSNDAFITITNGTGTGVGSALITFSVAANSGFRRIGRIFDDIYNRAVIINQTGECTGAVSLTPTNAYFSAAGGTGSFTTTVGVAGCTYTANANQPFVSISNADGVGSSTINFTVAPNTGVVRTMSITIYNGPDFGSASITLLQAGATYNRTGFDFDGDDRTDISVFRPDTRTWYMQSILYGLIGTNFGAAGDKIVPADYDGDGRTDLAVYRNGTWYVQRSLQGFVGIAFGTATDTPAPADYDGDGGSELAVYRPSNGTWYLYNLATNQTSSVNFGALEDKPVPDDYDGDGCADVAVFRPSNGTWYLQRSTLGFTGLQFGEAADKPVPADYDGDGNTDVAVFRPANGTWYIQRSTLGFTGIAFGAAGDAPIIGDFDRDFKADIGVFRNGVWYIRRSLRGLLSMQFGSSGDQVIPNAYVH